ncbi:MAG: AAA family ATPase, partial [Candidatus Paceibacterota bacterium]
RQYDIQLSKLLKQFPAVCLLGPRQSGKTTAAKNFIKNHKGKSIYLDLESYSDLQKLSNPEYYLDQFRDHLIVIDEVQFMPTLFPLLRHLIDDLPKVGRFL